MQTTRDFSRCPRCGAPTHKAIAFNGAESEFWYECDKCNTFINTYIPQEHQEAVHTDAHRITGNFGGYGSGKTLTSRQELYKHIFLTPNGNTLIGANVASQYEQTIKRDIEADLPKAFFKEFSTQKQWYDLINGHRIIYRPFDDPEKLRSYNLTMFIIVEASEVKQASFTQLKSRLRNGAAMLPERDENGDIKYRYTKKGVPIPIIKASWLKGIVESNPAAGWIRTDVLLKSSDIQKHGNNLESYAVPKEEMDPAISTHVTSAECNEFLPSDFIATLTKNKPAWWIARYVKGSFSYAEGLVYPAATSNIVPYFEVPKWWKRIVAYDYGLVDKSAFVFGAVDELANLLYIYKEIITDNKNIEDLAKLYHEGVADIPSGGMICAPIIDPKSGPKRDYDKKTLSDHFLEYNIAFQPGDINVDARIFRLNTYFVSGRVKIMDNCPYLIKELSDYKFKTDENAENGLQDKPEDKNNHAINALEWIVMKLPADPKNLVGGIYSSNGRRLDEQAAIRRDLNKSYAIDIFREEEDADTTEGLYGINNIW